MSGLSLHKPARGYDHRAVSGVTPGVNVVAPSSAGVASSPRHTRSTATLPGFRPKGWRVAAESGV